MEAILRAVREGNEVEVARLLDTDPSLLENIDEDMDEEERIEPLAQAARHGQLGVARLLIQRGADVNIKAPWTALQWAIVKGHEEVAGLLMSSGANVDDSYPLMTASVSGQLGMVRFLLKHLGGQEVHRRGKGGTALHFAAARGRYEVARVLLLAGADLTMTDDDERTPRTLAEDENLRTAWVDIDGNLSNRTPEEQAGCIAVFQVKHVTIYGDCMKSTVPAEVHPIYSPAHQMYCTVACVCQWWEGELERRYVLARATCLHKAYTTQRDMPTSQVPTYLEARVAAGHAVPSIEVVVPQSERRPPRSMTRTAEASGKRKGESGTGDETRVGKRERELDAMLKYVVKQLDEALVTELLEGFHSEKESGGRK
jgi:hypothetical protein